MPHHPAILWHTPQQTQLLRRIAAAASLQVVGVGAPDSTQSSALARQWRESGDEPGSVSDLRAAIATAQRGTVILIASPGTFGAPAPIADDPAASQLDVEELDAADARGVKVAVFEPLPCALTQLSEAGIRTDVAANPGSATDWATLIPLSRFTRPVHELREFLTSSGPARTLTIHALATPAHGSMGARLFDAADLAILLMGLPESVHAVYTSPVPLSARGTHPGPPPADHLRGLDGDLSATLRYDNNRAAVITASNHAAGCELAITALSESATATIRANRLTVATADQPPQEGATMEEVETGDDAFIAACADQLTRFLDSGVGLAGQVDFAGTLALAQAALLSARTGEPESPATMLRLAGR